MRSAIDLTWQVGRNVPIKQHNTQLGKEYRAGQDLDGIKSVQGFQKFSTPGGYSSQLMVIESRHGFV